MFEWGDNVVVEDINYDEFEKHEILCIDMKSFYASIEAVDRGLQPSQVPLAVIGDKERKGGVVLAATPAMKKKFGIGTASRVYQIPADSEIILVEARMNFYLEVSMEITRLFNEFVPLSDIHVYSVDEAWLKLDGVVKDENDSWEIAKEIKRELMSRFHLPSSMALGPNMFLAKVAMDVEGKEKGLVKWTYDDIANKLWPVSLKKCWGIGNRLAKKFKKIGIKTMGELAQLPLSYLENKFGIIGNQLYYHAWGIDLSEVEGHYLDKINSIGKGITLYKDYSDIEEIKTVIFELSEEIAKRARRYRVVGKTVHLSLSYSKDEFKSGFQQQKTIEKYSNLSFTIYKICVNILLENYNGNKVRKISVKLSNLVSDRNIQLNLFTEENKKLRLAEIKDNLQKKFHYKALFYGRSLKKGSIRERIDKTIGGHNAR